MWRSLGSQLSRGWRSSRWIIASVCTSSAYWKTTHSVIPTALQVQSLQLTTQVQSSQLTTLQVQSTHNRQHYKSTSTTDTATPASTTNSTTAKDRKKDTAGGNISGLPIWQWWWWWRVVEVTPASRSQWGGVGARITAPGTMPLPPEYLLQVLHKVSISIMQSHKQVPMGIRDHTITATILSIMLYCVFRPF